MARDLIFSATLLGIAAGYYVLASGMGRSALSDEVGPGGLPILYASILAFLAVAQAATTILRSRLRGVSRPGGRSHRDDGGSEPSVETAQPLTTVLLRAAGALAIGVGYLLIVPFAGYFLTLVLVIAATAIYFGERVSARLALIALGGAALFWLLFVALLGIPMPTLWGA